MTRGIPAAMTLSSIISPPWRTCAFAASPRLILSGITLAIGLIAVATQLWFGMLGDVSWLITIDEKWLSGQVPYVDFVEINPPASLLLYWPAVFLAHALGLRAEFVVSAFGFGSIAASLSLSALILKRAGLTVGPTPYAFVLNRARRASRRGVLRTRPSGRRLRPALSRALDRARRAGGEQISGSPRSPA